MDTFSNTSESFSDFVFKVLSVSNENIVGKIAMILWSVWKQRNNKLWNDSILPSAQATTSGYSFLCEWIEAKARSRFNAQNQHPQNGVHNGNDKVHWKLPPPTFVKCNVDVAFFKDQRVIGFGMVIRDDKGQFVAARTAFKEGLPSIQEGEAMGLLEAINWVTQMSLHSVRSSNLIHVI
ncbi:uncharacterized protein [Primulina eburnea]|uniref:uncharacterized protein n=1 Tax=Primulina eburnea TaxID=1245227 RepID=UPI003C6C5E25